MKQFLIGLSAAFFAPLAWGNPLSSAVLPAGVPQAGDLLTEDAKLACEAVLCLSSGKRPSECNESIARYFSIHHKKPHKTLQARRDFLNLCPSSREEGMPGLIEALVNGAGRCDAAELNRMGRYTVQKNVCRGYYGNENCYVVSETRICPTKPPYCRAYHSHEWTDVGGVRYVGEEQDGGHWVDVK